MRGAAIAEESKFAARDADDVGIDVIEPVDVARPPYAAMVPVPRPMTPTRTG